MSGPGLVFTLSSALASSFSLKYCSSSELMIWNSLSVTMSSFRFLKTRLWIEFPFERAKECFFLCSVTFGLSFFAKAYKPYRANHAKKSHTTQGMLTLIPGPVRLTAMPEVWESGREGAQTAGDIKAWRFELFCNSLPQISFWIWQIWDNRKLSGCNSR